MEPFSWLIKKNFNWKITWRIPWTEEPGGLQSMWSQTVGHHWATNTHTHLLYNVVLVSAVQQCKSAISIYIASPSWTCLPPCSDSFSVSLDKAEDAPRAGKTWFLGLSVRGFLPDISMRMFTERAWEWFYMKLYFKSKVKSKVKSLSSVRLLETPWTVA